MTSFHPSRQNAAAMGFFELPSPRRLDKPAPPFPQGAAVFGLVLAGIIVRLLPWRGIFTSDGVIPNGVDDCYHLWRAGRIAATFPALSHFDPYLSFPRGAPIPWPSGFDTLLALPALLGFGAEMIPAWSALLMPLLGGLAVYLVFRLGAALFDRATGLLAALLFALLPEAIFLSMLGRIDHHAAVAPVSVGMFLAFLASLRAVSPAARLWWGSLCGLLAGTAVAFWPITPPLYFLPIPAAIVLSQGAAPRPDLRRTAFACLGSTVVFVSLAVYSNADLAARPFSIYSLSWFLVLGYAVLALLACSALYGWRVFLAATAALGGIFLIPGVRDMIATLAGEAVALATGGNPAVSLAAETAPLLFPGGKFTLVYAVRNLTWFMPAAPFLLAAFGWRLVRRRPRAAGEIFFFVYAALGIGLHFLMIRFAEFATPAFALLFALALRETARFVRGLYRAPSRRTAAIAVTALLVPGIAAALSPLVATPATLSWSTMNVSVRDMLTFGKDLARRYPPPEDPQQVPASGVLTRWGDSHSLLYAWQLPVMVSAFGTAAEAQNSAGFSILLAADEEDAYRSLRANRIRFLVLSPIFTQANAMATIAGRPERFMQVSLLPDGREFYQPLAPYLGSLHARLYFGDGSAGAIAGYQVGALRHFRLVAETATTFDLLGATRPSFAAFEAVAGARLVGVAPPGTAAQLTLPVRSTTGRLFTYQSRTAVGADGTFSFTVPYPTPATGSRTLAVERYTVRTASGSYQAEVSEEQVQAGSAILLGP